MVRRCAAGAPRTEERTGRRSNKMGCNEGGIFETTELALHALGGVHGAELRGGRPTHGRPHRAEV